MESIRIASLQYFIRPVYDFSAFHDQVKGLVDTAADYHCNLLVFPEYFALQLLTLGDVRRTMREQIYDLAKQAPKLNEMMQSFARDNDIYIVGGSIPVVEPHTNRLMNMCHVFSPSGQIGMQPKIHLTRFEKEEWDMSGKREINTFETNFGRMGVAICYDVEFPEVARAHARNGANLLVVPSCTDDRQGFLRVRYCAHARAIENHMYVVQSSTVGSLPMVPAVSLNYGQASILTPSDFAFARDGIAAEGIPNQEAMVIADVSLETITSVHSTGTVLPLIDSERAQHLTTDSHIHPLISDDSRRTIVRNTKPEDFDSIISLCKRIYPTILPWTIEQLQSHHSVFPEGQFVALDPETGELAGMAASLIVKWDDYRSEGDFKSFTSGGTFRNHDPHHGRTLYGAEVMVDPKWRGQGVGKRLYDARVQLVKRLRLLRIRAGARLRGYHRYANDISAEEYTVRICRGEISDPTLSFQLKRGFRVLSVAANYLPGDAESLGYAAIIEWLNPNVATPKDYAAQPERYRPGE